MPQDVYTHGHHESVLRSHVWRSAENSAAHLLPELQAGLDLLDVGCGPGTITLDLARRVAPGRCVGIDRSPEVVGQAKATAAREGSSVEFREGDLYALAIDDASFDVAHAHQVLQHLTDPVAALRELHRVLRPGGLLALRDSDYSAFRWAPRDARLERWLDVYRAVARRNDAEPDAGPFLKGWALAAGFREPRFTSSNWSFADSASCQWWGGLWADRCELSSFATQAVDYGLATAKDLREMAQGFREWAGQPDAVFVVVHGEVLARKPPG